MTLPPKIAVADEVVSAELDGRIVLLDMQHEIYYSLDEVGSRMWQLISAEMGVDEIVATLLEEYDVEEQRLRGDLEALIARLQASSLVVLTA